MKFTKSPSDMNCNDVLQCIFELNKVDIAVYKKLKKMGESRTDTLTKKMNKERSTIYRSLQKLTSCGLCIKKTEIIEKGGYYHTYSCKDSKQVKGKIKSCIDEWHKNMKKTLQDFEREMG